jgi:hypothetical protein
VQFDTGGGKHVGTPTIRARWYAARARIKARTGTTLFITSGWNVYRPYAEQIKGRAEACRQGNCLAAASPGYSSHGGTWINGKWTGGVWKDAFAIDVNNYYEVPWAIFKEEFEKVGFKVGAITTAIAGREEPWHIIDLDPYGGFTAGGGEIPFPIEEQSQEKNMILLEGKDSTSSGTTILVVAGPGIWDRYGISSVSRASLEDQFGKPVVLTDAAMLEKEALYKGSTTTAGEINNALQDDFAGIVAAVKAVPGQIDAALKDNLDAIVAATKAVESAVKAIAITGGSAAPTAAQNATAVREILRTDPLK